MPQRSEGNVLQSYGQECQSYNPDESGPLPGETAGRSGTGVPGASAAATQAATSIPVDQQQIDETVAGALRDILAAGCSFKSARLLIGPAPHSPNGVETLARRFYDLIYESSANPLSESGIPIGSQVDLTLTFPAVVFFLRRDDDGVISTDTKGYPTEPCDCLLSLRVFDAKGKPRIVVLFDDDDEHERYLADLERSGGKTCLVKPSMFFLFLRILAQATDIRLNAWLHCDEQQGALISDPMRLFAKTLHADLLKADGLNMNVVRQGAVSAVKAARIVANIQCPMDLEDLASQPTVQDITACVPEIMSAVQMVRDQESTAQFGIFIHSLVEEQIPDYDNDPPPDLELGNIRYCSIVPSRYLYGEDHARRQAQASIVKNIAASSGLQKDDQDLEGVAALVFCALAILDQSPEDIAKIGNTAALVYQTGDAYYRLWYILRQRFPAELLMCAI